MDTRQIFVDSHGRRRFVGEEPLRHDARLEVIAASWR